MGKVANILYTVTVKNIETLIYYTILIYYINILHNIYCLAFHQQVKKIIAWENPKQNMIQTKCIAHCNNNEQI